MPGSESSPPVPLRRLVEARDRGLALRRAGALRAPRPRADGAFLVLGIPRNFDAGAG
jgi:hypothetical protein